MPKVIVHPGSMLSTKSVLESASSITVECLEASPLLSIFVEKFTPQNLQGVPSAHVACNLEACWTHSKKGCQKMLYYCHHAQAASKVASIIVRTGICNSTKKTSTVDTTTDVVHLQKQDELLYYSFNYCCVL